MRTHLHTFLIAAISLLFSINSISQVTYEYVDCHVLIDSIVKHTTPAFQVGQIIVYDEYVKVLVHTDNGLLDLRYHELTSLYAYGAEVEVLLDQIILRTDLCTYYYTMKPKSIDVKIVGGWED